MLQKLKYERLFREHMDSLKHRERVLKAYIQDAQEEINDLNQELADVRKGIANLEKAEAEGQHLETMKRWYDHDRP